MSTKNEFTEKALKTQAKLAKKELQSAKNALSFRKKRVTRQVRIDESLHKKIRYAAFENGVTMSKYLDSIVLSANKQVHPRK